MSGVAEALLIVHLFLSASGVYPVDRAYEFSSMQECIESLKSSQFKISTGGDAESIGALYCVPNKSTNHYHYSHANDKYKKIIIVPDK